MKTIILSPKRLLLEFPTRKEMTLSNFRISEFKEGKEGIKGKYFTADEFIDAYSDKDGNIDYFSYWEGFNYSKKEVLNFAKIFDANLSNREILILDSAKYIDDDGYIICMEEGDQMTLKHEIAHGIFFENEEYKNKASEIVNSIPVEILEKYKNDLREMDYGEDCLIDECHAYMVAFDKEEFDECFSSVNTDEIETQINSIGLLFDEYNK